MNMDKLKHTCDAVAACSAIVTIVGWLPVVLGTVASTLSIIWYGIRFYEWYKGKRNGN
jgi:hypothetical protein